MFFLNVSLYLSSFYCSLSVNSCFDVVIISSMLRSVISLILSPASVSSLGLILFIKFLSLPWILMCCYRINSRNSPIYETEGSGPSSYVRQHGQNLWCFLSSLLNKCLIIALSFGLRSRCEPTNLKALLPSSIRTSFIWSAILCSLSFSFASSI